MEKPSKIIADSIKNVRTKSFAAHKWGERHCRAWAGGIGEVDLAVRMREGALRDAIVAWAMLAETHQMMYGSLIGEDGVLGPAWKEMGEGLRTQLNGQCGRFDCGTLDALILDISHASGAPMD